MGGLLADLLEGARRRNLSANSLTAYERTWRALLAWAAAASLDPRALSFPTALEGYRFLGEGKNATSLKQIRAALSFAYRHWDLKNPFAKIDPPLHKEPQIRYLLLSDIRRLLAYLKSHARQGYGSALAFQLANALFQTACRFDELIQLAWADCQAVGKEIVALRIKGKGSVFQDVPVTSALSAALLEWEDIQEKFKGRRILAPAGSPSRLRSLCLRDTRDCHFPTARSICDCERRAGRSGWGRSPPTGCGIPRPRSSLITSERIFGRSRSSSATRISAPPCATPTSATSRPGRRPRRSARLSSEAMLAALAAKVPFIHWALHPF